MRTTVCPPQCTDKAHAERCPVFQADALQEGLGHWQPTTLDERNAKDRVLMSFGFLYAAVGPPKS